MLISLAAQAAGEIPRAEQARPSVDHRRERSGSILKLPRAWCNLTSTHILYAGSVGRESIFNNTKEARRASAFDAPRSWNGFEMASIIRRHLALIFPCFTLLMIEGGTLSNVILL